jgi:hypothetical protein
LLAWIEVESFRVRSPAFADELVWCEAFEGLEPAGEIVSVDEVAKMGAQLVLVVVVVAFDGRVLDGPVHSLELTIRPGVIWLGEPIFDAVLAADLVEAVHPIARGPAVAVARQVCELDPVVGKHRMQAIGCRGDQRFEESDSRGAIGLLMQLHEANFEVLSMPTNRWSLPSLVLTSAMSFVKEADRIRLELLLRGLFPFDLREPADAVSLQAAMQGRPRQMGNGCLQGVETIVERQEGMAPERDDDRLLFD